jgi:hypothetical protein
MLSHLPSVRSQVYHDPSPPRNSSGLLVAGEDLYVMTNRLRK